MTQEAMRQHIEELVAAHGIAVDWRRATRAMSWGAEKKIRIAHITTERSYALALHEIGHCVEPTAHGPRYSRLDKELSAWEWAERHAVEWTERMDEERARSLGCYVSRARRRRWSLPPANHRLWRVCY